MVAQLPRPMVVLPMALMLLLGCAHSKDKYPPPPLKINVTAELNERAIKRENMLRQLTLAHPESGSYRIGPNDVIDIKVFEQARMDASARVGGNGMINFPPLGNLRAAGLTERELENKIQDGLRGGYIRDPHVTVFTREIQARMYGIIGAVNLAGQYSSFGRMHLADLISKAGGLKPEAGEVAYVIRFQQPAGEDEDSSETIKVDLDGLLVRGDRQWNIPLEASDLVNIPTAGTVFITGLGIQKPGTYPLVNRMTLQQLVDLAEGLKFEGDRRILLVRTSERGEKSIYNVNYNELRASRTEDIQLRAGDKVIVDRTPFKTALAMTGRALAAVLRVVVGFDYRYEVNNNDESSNGD
ncbi:polysaccharide biosynthesis/export family protein [bacterium]|nr:polysaccharide biosynthesis/export family protein [bacterium]